MFMHSCGSIGVLYCVVLTQNSNGFKTLFENGFGKPLLKIKRAKEFFLSPFLHFGLLAQLAASLSSMQSACPIPRPASASLSNPAGLRARSLGLASLIAGPRRRAPPLSLALARWLHGPAPCNAATPGPLVSDAPFFYLKSASSRTLPRETRCPTPESPLIRLVSHAQRPHK